MSLHVQFMVIGAMGFVLGLVAVPVSGLVHWPRKPSVSSCSFKGTERRLKEKTQGK